MRFAHKVLEFSAKTKGQARITLGMSYLEGTHQVSLTLSASYQIWAIPIRRRKVSRKPSEPPPNSQRSPQSERNPSGSSWSSIAKHLLTLRIDLLISSNSTRSWIRSKKRSIERSQTSGNPLIKQIRAAITMKAWIRTPQVARYHLHISSRKGMVVLRGRLLKRTLRSSGLCLTSIESKMIEPP